MARAYAKAAYQIARENQAIQSWEDFLNNLNILIQVPEIKDLINHPQVSKQDLEFILCRGESCIRPGESTLNDPQKINFLKILISDHVLNLSPEIFQLFKDFLAEDLGICEAVLESAIELSPEKIENLRKDLNQKYHKEFKLNLKINHKLIGGFKIRTKHFVIDNSIETRLKQLEKNLSQACEVKIEN